MSVTVWLSEDDEEIFVLSTDDRWRGRQVVVDVQLAARYVQLRREWSELQDELARLYIGSRTS